MEFFEYCKVYHSCYYYVSEGWNNDYQDYCRHNGITYTRNT